MKEVVSALRPSFRSSFALAEAALAVACEALEALWRSDECSSESDQKVVLKALEAAQAAREALRGFGLGGF